MAEKDSTEQSTRKHIRQPPAVPFLWEERPGIPKKDWKLHASSLIPVMPPPVKLTASIPFNWEEKPGKPLPSFSLPPSGSPTSYQSAELTSLPLPPLYSETCDDISNSDNHSTNSSTDNGVDLNDKQEIFKLDLETFGFETDDSFSSAPSLLANCLLSSAPISTAVPVGSIDNISDPLEIPSSPASETDSSTSSYATGTSNLAGASFLECLFPLFPPNSGFLEKVAYSEKGSHSLPEVKSKDFDGESDSSNLVRRAPTLGELIMLSRRRSYQRKAAQMRKNNLSMELMKKRASGCCFFRTSIKTIEGLQWKNFQPRLKLI